MKMTEETMPSIDVRIERIQENGGNTKAYASLTLGNAFAVHGIRLVETDKGLRARMPFRTYKSKNDTKYQDVFHAISSEAHEVLEMKITDAYYNALEQNRHEGAPEFAHQV